MEGVRTPEMINGAFNGGFNEPTDKNKGKVL